jgi:hypothetical protein
MIKEQEGAHPLRHHDRKIHARPVEIHINPLHPNRSFYPSTMQNLHDCLVDGKVVIPLVNLNTNNSYLEPGDIHADASHWVAVLQKIETNNGVEFVYINNPYQNREEWLSYEDFKSSWQLYGKSNRGDERMESNYRAVIATPPEEIMWLPNP